MGPHGRLGSAAKTMRYLAATGAQGVVQVGMAFGVSSDKQKLGDVLVSALLSPYDNRAVKPRDAPPGRVCSCILGCLLRMFQVKPRDAPPGYVYDYEGVKVEKPRAALLDRFRIEKERREKAGESEFKIHIGAMLSGAARIHCAAYRDELLRIAPSEGEEFVGGEMEGVGLLSGSMKAGDPVWCVVKGISDFADENRDNDIKTGREKASYHAALFVLSSLLNDTKEPTERGET